MSETRQVYATLKPNADKMSLFYLAAFLAVQQHVLCNEASVECQPTEETPAHADPQACKLAAIDSGTMGFPLPADAVPSTGSVNGFMLFVDFPDATDDARSIPGLRDNFLPQSSEWYATSSYGRLNLTIGTDETAFIRMPAVSSSYGYKRGLSYELHLKYIQDALEAYGKSVSTDVLYIVPTRKASEISFSPTLVTPVNTRAGTLVAKRAVTFGQDAFEAFNYKVLDHETGHAMGLPDYYPFVGGTNGQYVGGWSVMGWINGPSPDYFGWDKWRLGWLDDRQIDCVSTSGSSTHILLPIDDPNSSPSTKLVVIKKSDTDAIVAEVRSNHGNDAATCSQGVLVYQLSTERASGSGPLIVADANPSTIGCENEPLNDAPLSIGGSGADSITIDGVVITLTQQTGQSYTIQVQS